MLIRYHIGNSNIPFNPMSTCVECAWACVLYIGFIYICGTHVLQLEVSRGNDLAATVPALMMVRYKYICVSQCIHLGTVFLRSLTVKAEFGM